MRSFTVDLNKIPRGIVIFSAIEMLIGFLTLSALTLSLIFGFNAKPFNVLMFVYVTSLLSFWLGVGLLFLNKQSYELLLFLAGVVIVTKILIFANIMHLNGALVTTLNPSFKNLISILYHCMLCAYLNRPSIKALFKKGTNR